MAELGLAPTTLLALAASDAFSSLCCLVQGMVGPVGEITLSTVSHCCGVMDVSVFSEPRSKVSFSSFLFQVVYFGSILRTLMPGELNKGRGTALVSMDA